MTRPTAYQKRQAKARQRRRRKAPERRERAKRQAQRAAEALHQALEDLGRPANVVVESAGRVHSQQKRLGTMVGVMLPALLGCRTPAALCRVRGWEKHGPARLLGALPTRSWLQRRRRLGPEVVEPVWRHVHEKSPATQRRWPWPWVWDDAVCHQYGAQVGWVGRGWSGPHKRVWSGMDGLVLRVVMGDGRSVVAVDCALRRPEPRGPGAQAGTH